MPNNYTNATLTTALGRPVVASIYARNEPETAGACRQAFAFFRRNADRRYSASVLMSLLTHAEAIEADAERGVLPDSSEDDAAHRYPAVMTLGTPFEYDEETEVKSGGLVGVAVLLPDNRVLFAVLPDQRRKGVGREMTRLLAGRYDYFNLNWWIHQENRDGQQFALAVGLMPYQVNRHGAVLYRATAVEDPDVGAVEWMEDDEIERQLRRGSRRPLDLSSPRRPAARRPVARMSVEEPSPLDLRNYEEARITWNNTTDTEICEADSELDRIMGEEAEIERQLVGRVNDEPAYHADFFFLEVDQTSLRCHDRHGEALIRAYQNAPHLYSLPAGRYEGLTLRQVWFMDRTYIQGLVTVGQVQWLQRILNNFLDRQIGRAERDRFDAAIS